MLKTEMEIYRESSIREEAMWWSRSISLNEHYKRTMNKEKFNKIFEMQNKVKETKEEFK